MFQRVLLTIGVNEKVSIDTGSHCRSTCTVPEDVCLKEKIDACAAALSGYKCRSARVGFRGPRALFSEKTEIPAISA